MIREGNIGLRQLYCYLTFILLATGGTVVMTLPMSEQEGHHEGLANYFRMPVNWGRTL